MIKVQAMNDLWAAIADLAGALHGERVEAVARAVKGISCAGQLHTARHSFGPSVDPALFDSLKRAWEANTEATPGEVAAALLAALSASNRLHEEGTIELVWTGPKTGLIPIRRTDQVLLELIESARQHLFLVSFVFFGASRLVEAMNRAAARGVHLKILLESSLDRGGTVKGDCAMAMHQAVPDAVLYVWRADKKSSSAGSASASVHAKCAVADGELAFITSANLTSAALARNMELGVLIRGGSHPHRLQSHLQALVQTDIIATWKP